MKAIRIHFHGGPEVLSYEDAPRPEPASGQTLVRVHAAGVNPVDWKCRQGLRAPREAPFVWTPGLDVSGVIESFSGAPGDLSVGDEVYAMTPIADGGCYAEFVCVATDSLALKPKSLSHVEAAALPVVALTAWQALFEVGELRAGQTVLILGASGGVGHVAVQLAQWKGARVIATASARNRDFVLGLGADVLVDYKTERFEQVVRDVDVVFDAIPVEVSEAGDALAAETRLRALGVLRKGGAFASITKLPPEEAVEARGVRAGHTLARSSGENLTRIAELVDSGRLRGAVAATFPLSEARKAQELSAQGHTRGKIVLQVVA
jgi:NADPH:quinone reductase-like Zn-dependent oxidoreductase